MKLFLSLIACAFGLSACAVHEKKPRPELAATGRIETKRMQWELPGHRKVVLAVRFTELETRDWKVAQMRVRLDNAPPVTLSDSFIQGMWCPSPEAIDAWNAGTTNGITTINISTGDGGETKLSRFQIDDFGKVVELTP